MFNDDGKHEDEREILNIQEEQLIVAESLHIQGEEDQNLK